MAELDAGATRHATDGERTDRWRRVRHGLDVVLGPLWRTTFRDPVRHGRLRLDGLSGPERQLARVGLVLLGLLLVSVLFAEVWRRGELLFLDLSSGPHFVPEALVPVTLVAFFVAVALVVWGAMDAAPSVRLVVAVLYTGTIAALGTTAGFGETWILRHGTTLLRAAFVVPAAALVVSAALTRARRAERWATPVLRALALLALVAMLGTLLWSNHDFQAAGYTSVLPAQINTGFSLIDVLQLPLLILAGIGVVDFATDVSTSLTEPASRAGDRHRWLLWAVVAAVVAVKLWSQVGRELDHWRAYAERQPDVLVRTVAFVVAIAVVSLLVARLVPGGSDDDVDQAKERLGLVGAFVVTTVPLLVVVLSGLTLLASVLAPSERWTTVVDDFPSDVLSDWVPLAASVVALATGLALLPRCRSGRATGGVRELATGLLVVGLWNAPLWTILTFHLSEGFSYQAMDVLVTVAAVAWLASRGPRATVPQLSVALAVLLFSWLVTSRGDYLSYLGGLLGLPGLVVVVFGIVYTLASGASFTTESSPRLPREARTLMFTGYVLLSVTILHWGEAVHLPPTDASGSGFLFLALPLAAWLVARRILPRAGAAQAATGLR